MYKYTAAWYLDHATGLWMIQLGCYVRARQDWDANFWNNPSEFPHDPNNAESMARLRAYKIMCAAIDASNNA